MTEISIREFNSEIYDPLSWEDLREAINILDEEIASLILKRRDFSRKIREKKIAEGLPDVDISRENLVIGSYVTELDSRYFGGLIGSNILDFSKA